MATPDALLDTSILIDISRSNADAIGWLNNQRQTLFGLPVLVCMEFVDGARDSAERRKALELINRFPMIHLTPVDTGWAQQQHAKHKLSHNVGIHDALIAASAVRLAIPIYTLNLKHFSALSHVNTVRPY